MKQFILLVTLLLPAHFLFGQVKQIKVSDKLELIRLSPETYMHISEGSNGMVTVNTGEGTIISTPPTDEATLQLINWVEDSLKVKIVGVVIDSWHPDNMEGLDVFHTQKIKSYANEMTQQIAVTKGLPVPKVGFAGKMELKVGSKKLVLQHFGSAHTRDGIVAWIPDEKILFGNNGVRNFNGWVGNIGDANLQEWAETIEKVKKEFGSAKYVIPGHGNYGGPELLDYTINLYQPGLWGKILKENNIRPSRVFDDYGRVFIEAQNDSVSEALHHVTDAMVFVDKGKQYIIIESPMIKFDTKNSSIRSEYGRMKIINKETGSDLPEADGYYQTLMIDFREDAVGMTIILKGFIQ